IVVTIAVIVITIQIQGLYETFEEGFRHAYFQVASIISTTGYSTVDYANTWPVLSLIILLLLMLAGSCAGSTAGGIKQSRVIIIIKYSKSKLVNLISPRKVNVIRLDGKPLDNSIVDSTVVFFVIYIMMIIVSTFLISIWNPNMPAGDSNPLTMFSASLACISNIGPGLGAVGPAGGFAQFSWFSKLVLANLMLAGRLELFPILILFFPGTWKKNI
ncbi:MAG: hypothetical protein K6B64_06420, partial [Acholeplasmatales bacterium]|nr:hypothetical protein [Acholeplasmatales bacterium]